MSPDVPCTCGRANHVASAARCSTCYNEERAKKLDAKRVRCDTCGRKMARSAITNRCSSCVVTHGRLKVSQHVTNVVRDEAKVAPKIAATPRVTDSAIVVTDLHIPWHNPDVVLDFCEVAVLLGVKTLIVGGDLLHADVISKYVGVGKSVPITKELESCGRVLSALEEVFDKIIVVPGNHDQRFERMIAGLRDTKQGRQGLEMVAKLLGCDDPDDAENVSLRYLRHFLGSTKVEWHALPDLILNDTWLIQHPGTCSRVAPQSERAMVRKFRKSVIQGHTHLWGVGFDESATDIAFNCGHCADDKKWRYMREKITSFPTTVHGYGIVYRTEKNPGGRLIPVAIHDRMFRIQDLAEMLKGTA